MIYDFICIGYGVATASFILSLTSVQLTGTKILIFDPYFDGGELPRNYGNVQSNTTWAQFIDAVSKYCSPAKLNYLNNIHERHKTTTLDELIYQYLQVVNAAVSSSAIKIHKRSEIVHEVNYSSDEKCWTVNGFIGKILINCPGADPKHLHLPKPTLQLSSVLNHTNLPCRPGEHAIVFGTAHSGTLAIKSLVDLGLRVSAIYNGSKPFKYARDGEYDGIKQESAIIADTLPSTVKLISNSDENSVRSELLDCDWVLYACGFDRRKNIIFKFNNLEIDKVNINYDSNNGRLIISANGNENKLPAFGFGIAYPNSNIIDGKTYYDVSLPAFLHHIEKNLLQILGSLY
jgi:hypothetical protein